MDCILVLSVHVAACVLVQVDGLMLLDVAFALTERELVLMNFINGVITEIPLLISSATFGQNCFLLWFNPRGAGVFDGVVRFIQLLPIVLALDLFVLFVMFLKAYR